MKVRENHRVVVMGAGGVGKTSLVTLFMEGVFTTTYKPTIEDYYRHTVQFPGKETNLLSLSLSRFFLSLFFKRERERGLHYAIRGDFLFDS